MGCDPCGSCFHRWDFWNDCDACGGKTLAYKIVKIFFDTVSFQSVSSISKEETEQYDCLVGELTVTNTITLYEDIRGEEKIITLYQENAKNIGVKIKLFGVTLNFKQELHGSAAVTLSGKIGDNIYSLGYDSFGSVNSIPFFAVTNGNYSQKYSFDLNERRVAELILLLYGFKFPAFGELPHLIPV